MQDVLGEGGADLFRKVFDLALEAMVVTDAEDSILAVNPAFSSITGFAAKDVVGQAADFLRSGLHDQSFFAEMREALKRDGRWEGDLWNRRKSGEPYRSRLSVVAERDEAGTIVRQIAVFRDITEMRETSEKLWQRSNYDWLTELPNRGLFLDRLIQALVVADESQGKIGLLFIGLDGFKHINDALGHTVGDKVLNETARRFERALRPGDTVARFGGDEFTAVLTNIQSVDQLEAVIRALLETLHEPFLVESHRVLLSCSIGACMWPGDGEDVEALMRNATSAMRSAKAAGRNTYRFFTPAMDIRAQARSKLAAELSAALENEEFHLVYQPIIELESGRVAGAEALLRWHNPYVGAVSPDQFVSLAEEMGLILPIGAWLMGAACRQAAKWQGGDAVRIAVNVSPRQVAQGNVAAMLEDALNVSGLLPNLLTVEITESLLLGSGEEVLAQLARIREIGARIAVDDFGTGYSSLSYLKHFPVDVLKIDRSFVSGAAHNAEDARLIEAIIALGHSLNMKVVGEGVETLDQLAFLSERGCDFAQGYLFSPPLSDERLAQFMQSRG